MKNTLVRRGTRVLLGVAALATALGTSACDSANSAWNSVGNLMVGGSSGPQQGQQGYVKGFLGGVSADEPRAALAGRDVLSAGGTAADAAIAMGLMLSVTLPSRASLGGGGACLVYNPDKASINKGKPEAVLFAAPPGGGSGDRPAAVPLMARGLYALGARYGKLPFEQISIRAEQAARDGVPVSRALERDLAVVAGPLGGDPLARAIFLDASGRPRPEGSLLRQPDLAATLGQMRLAGVGDLYNGTLQRRMAAAATAAGGGVTESALRAALPSWAAPIEIAGRRGDTVAFLPVDGGLAAAVAFKALQAAPDDLAGAQSKALAAVAAWRQGGVSVESLLNGPAPAAPALGHMPASTAFLAMDRSGEVVGCALSMNNLFGTGRIAPGTGVVLAASPASAPEPLLSVAIGYNSNLEAFHGAATGTGQEGAPVAAADGVRQVLNAALPVRVPFGDFRQGGVDPVIGVPEARLETRRTVLRIAPDPGRANVLGCSGYLPGDEDSCGWTVDPRVAGLALGSN